MKKIIDVQTGEIKVSSKNVVLKSSGIGSCIAIAFYDHKKKTGGLAHIMLPGSAPTKKNIQRTKYAVNAVEMTLNRMRKLGVDIKDIIVCMIGGANVLKEKKDTICKANFDSVMKCLKNKKIKIKKQSIGGTERRSIVLDMENEKIYYTCGNNNTKILLWHRRYN